MARESIHQRLEAEFDTPPEDLRAVVGLLEAGASPQFIALYRRDETGDPGEPRISAIHERLSFLTELESRKQTILEHARGDGADTSELEQLLAGSVDQDLLDDLDHFMRAGRHRASEVAAQLGLDDLVRRVHEHDLGGLTPHEAAAPYVAEEKGLATAEAVLEAVVLALAERYGEDARLRAEVRDELSRGLLRAAAAAPGKVRKKSRRYEEFFDFQEPVRRISAQRMLALRRAEREGIIHVRLHLAEDRELDLFRRRFSPEVAVDSPLGQFLDLIYRHSYEHYVHQSCESAVRHRIKEKADRDTVRSFARTLRAQLMAPPLGDRRAMALRASGKHVWVATLAEDGAVSRRESFDLGDGGEQREAVIAALVELVRGEHPAAVAIPHGRREESAARLVRSVLDRLDTDERPFVAPLDETAALVHATSADGRRRQSGVDTGLRATLSLARRLRDPLRELLRVEARGLGLGQNLTEVHQGLLTRQLDAALCSCVARTGIDVNTADQSLLARAPGVGRELAQAVVAHREKHGRFATRADLRAVEGVDDDRFRWFAGFMRVHGGADPIDATSVHPEDRSVVEKIAASKGCAVADLLGKGHRDVRLQDLISPECGRLRALDVLDALTLGGRDPRGVLTPLQNDGVASFDDLRVDQRLRGRITNVTEFGAFVDLGIGQDGLVHVSQIPGARLRDPAQALRVGEVVTVYIVHFAAKDRRISLSMLKPRHLAEGRTPTLGERMAPGKGRHGKRRGPREERQVQSRAARAPEGRRGAMRKGPRPPRPKGDHAGEGAGRGGLPGRGGGGGGRRGAPPAPSGKPRVVTVESDRQLEEARGHKGELRSLAGLRALLERGGGEAPPAADPAPPRPPESQ